MNTIIPLKNHIVHLWRAQLTDFLSAEEEFLRLLNPDELQRAYRFHFPQHRQRFAIARGILRKLLSQYTGIAARVIQFELGPHGKPYLSDNPMHLQFNVSHSDDVAVYALTIEVEIGVDVQKKETEFEQGVAKRFFSTNEYEQIMSLPEEERAHAFYQLWASKEALIKAVGGGLFVPLDKFSVDLHKQTQWIEVTHEQQMGNYFLANVDSFSGYCSALATAQNVEEILYFDWV